MADAERRETTREVTTAVTESRVVLTLSPGEAETLLAVTRAIGGDPEMSRRAHTDAIGSALRNAGVFDGPMTYQGMIVVESPLPTLDSSISFQEELTETVDGVVYRPDDAFWDKDGDRWVVHRAGSSLRASCVTYHADNLRGQLIGNVHAEFGPLRKTEES